MDVPSSNETPEQLSQLFKFHVVSQFARIFSQAFPWACATVMVVAVAYYGGLDVNALISATIVTDSGAKPISGWQWGMYLVPPWVLAISGWMLFFRESTRHKDTIERFGDTKTRLERVIDPGRSSSFLTPRGETQQEDR